MTRTYSGLLEFDNFHDRFEYLKLSGTVGELTFAAERYLNQSFYNSNEWRPIRNKIIVRDYGRDLALPGYDIHGLIIVHHINPITINDIINHNPSIVDPENLVCVSHATHNAIHYGDFSMVNSLSSERKPNDTIPWR